MSLKVLSDSDIFSVLSVLTREGRDSSFLLEGGVRVFERSRLFEVLNDVAFKVEDDPAPERGPEQSHGSRSTHREQEPEPEGRDLRGREAVVAAGDDDGDAVRRQAVRKHLEAKRDHSRQLAAARVRSRRSKSRR